MSDDAGLDTLYEGQLDAVLEAWRDAELRRLRYTNPLRLTDDPADHACHGCALDPTKHPR